MQLEIGLSDSRQTLVLHFFQFSSFLAILFSSGELFAGEAFRFPTAAFFTFDHNLGILPCIAVSWMMLLNVLLYDLFCWFFTRYF